MEPAVANIGFTIHRWSLGGAVPPLRDVVLRFHSETHIFTFVRCCHVQKWQWFCTVLYWVSQ